MCIFFLLFYLVPSLQDRALLRYKLGPSLLLLNYTSFKNYTSYITETRKMKNNYSKVKGLLNSFCFLFCRYVYDQTYYVPYFAANV